LCVSSTSASTSTNKRHFITTIIIERDRATTVSDFISKYFYMITYSEGQRQEKKRAAAAAAAAAATPST
jgi:hypothetical protein